MYRRHVVGVSRGVGHNAISGLTVSSRTFFHFPMDIGSYPRLRRVATLAVDSDGGREETESIIRGCDLNPCVASSSRRTFVITTLTQKPCPGDTTLDLHFALFVHLPAVLSAIIYSLPLSLAGCHIRQLNFSTNLYPNGLAFACIFNVPRH